MPADNGNSANLGSTRDSIDTHAEPKRDNKENEKAKATLPVRPEVKAKLQEELQTIRRLSKQLQAALKRADDMELRYHLLRGQNESLLSQLDAVKVERDTMRARLSVIAPERELYVTESGGNEIALGAGSPPTSPPMEDRPSHLTTMATSAQGSPIGGAAVDDSGARITVTSGGILPTSGQVVGAPSAPPTEQLTAQPKPEGPGQAPVLPVGSSISVNVSDPAYPRSSPPASAPQTPTASATSPVGGWLRGVAQGLSSVSSAVSATASSAAPTPSISMEQRIVQAVQEVEKLRRRVYDRESQHLMKTQSLTQQLSQLRRERDAAFVKEKRYASEASAIARAAGKEAEARATAESTLDKERKIWARERQLLQEKWVRAEQASSNSTSTAERERERERERNRDDAPSTLEGAKYTNEVNDDVGGTRGTDDAHADGGDDLSMLRRDNLVGTASPAPSSPAAGSTRSAPLTMGQAESDVPPTRQTRSCSAGQLSDHNDSGSVTSGGSFNLAGYSTGLEGRDGWERSCEILVEEFGRYAMQVMELRRKLSQTEISHLNSQCHERVVDLEDLVQMSDVRIDAVSILAKNIEFKDASEWTGHVDPRVELLEMLCEVCELRKMVNELILTVSAPAMEKMANFRRQAQQESQGQTRSPSLSAGGDSLLRRLSSSDVKDFFAEKAAGSTERLSSLGRSLEEKSKDFGREFVLMWQRGGKKERRPGALAPQPLTRSQSEMGVNYIFPPSSPSLQSVDMQTSPSTTPGLLPSSHTDLPPLSDPFPSHTLSNAPCGPDHQAPEVQFESFDNTYPPRERESANAQRGGPGVSGGGAGPGSAAGVGSSWLWSSLSSASTWITNGSQAPEQVLQTSGPGKAVDFRSGSVPPPPDASHVRSSLSQSQSQSQSHSQSSVPPGRPHPEGSNDPRRNTRSLPNAVVSSNVVVDLDEDGYTSFDQLPRPAQYARPQRNNSSNSDDDPPNPLPHPHTQPHNHQHEHHQLQHQHQHHQQHQQHHQQHQLQHHQQHHHQHQHGAAVGRSKAPSYGLGENGITETPVLADPLTPTSTNQSPEDAGDMSFNRVVSWLRGSSEASSQNSQSPPTAHR